MRYFFVSFLALSVFCYATNFCLYPKVVRANSNSLKEQVKEDINKQKIKNTPKFPKAKEYTNIVEKTKNNENKILSICCVVSKKIWKGSLIIGNKILKRIRQLWNSYIYPSAQKYFTKAKNFILTEISNKEPKVKREFQKEKQEIKKDIPSTGKLIWQKFKDLIR